MLLLSSRVDIKITVAISTTLCSVHGCRDPGEDCGKTISQAHAYYESHQLLLVAVDTITTASYVLMLPFWTFVRPLTL